MKSFALFLGSLFVLYFCGACGSSSGSSSNNTTTTCPALSLAGFYATTSAPYTPVGSSTVQGDLTLPIEVWSQFITVSEDGTATAVFYMYGASNNGQIASGTWESVGENTIQFNFGDFFYIKGTVTQNANTCAVTASFNMINNTQVHIHSDEAVTATFNMVQYPHNLTAADLAGTWREDVMISINNSNSSETKDQLNGKSPTLIISSDGQVIFKTDTESEVGYLNIINNYSGNLAGDTTVDIITFDLVNNQLIMDTYDDMVDFGSGPVPATTFRIYTKI